MIEIGISLGAIGGETPSPFIAVSHQAAYALDVSRVRHEAPYSLDVSRVRHRAVYGLRVDGVHQAIYDLSLRDPVRVRHRGGYSILADYSLQSIANQPELVHAGRVIGINAATLSCDEDSPVWIASVEVANLSDFALMQIGDALTLTLGIETFALVVDGKTMSRGGPAQRQHQITAVSPLALLETPFAAEISYQAAATMSAEAAVEYFIGAVDWQLPTWLIPAAALVFEAVTPLMAARSIVSAIGGVIESNPDGTVVCRPRHPVSVPDYEAATPDHQLFDSDVISSAAQIAPVRGFNRVTVANEVESGGGSGSPDRLEYVGTDSISGVVRAYPNPVRAVDLVHTGNPATTISAVGTVSRQETETVEFVSGRASTQYPVAAIVSTTWRAADLGTVTASGNALSSSVEGYSLLEITYTVESVNWNVGLDADEKVQFVLMDA